MIKKQYSKTKPVCKVTFSVPVAQVGEGVDLRVLGQFNEWSWDKGLRMPAKKDSYQADLELAAGQAYEFRYMANGQAWFNDEAADDYTATPFFSHNSVLVLEAVAVEEKAAPTKKAAKAADVAPVAKAAETKAAEPKAAPAKKAAPKKADKPATDDLTKIEGVGPKIAQLLNAAGIITFADLAKAKPAKLREVLDQAGPRFKVHDPASWGKQAKLAAAGEWDTLATLQEQLKGGK